MRVIFTAYAINSAFICFLMTMALMMCDEFSDRFDYFLSFLIEYMFVVFGPILLLLGCIGLGQLPMSQDCEIDLIA